jgi:hypothetical protein
VEFRGIFLGVSPKKCCFAPQVLGVLAGIGLKLIGLRNGGREDWRISALGGAVSTYRIISIESALDNLIALPGGGLVVKGPMYLGAKFGAAARRFSKSGCWFNPLAIDSCGGCVYTSTVVISQEDNITYVESARYQGKNVNVVTGAHGLPDGSLQRAKLIYQNELAKFSDFRGVKSLRCN